LTQHLPTDALNPPTWGFLIKGKSNIRINQRSKVMVKSLFRIILLLSIAIIGKSLFASDLDKGDMRHQLSISVSSYKYTEPNLPTLVTGGISEIKFNGTKLGLEYLGTLRLDDSNYLLGGVEYNNGPVDYEGTGKTTSIPEYYYGAKIAFGKKYKFSEYSIMPYIGYGYRYLKQSWGGMTTSTGAKAYDRISTYNYMPLGIIHEKSLSSKDSSISTTLEYNNLLSGNQFSGLSILNGTYGANTYTNIPDVNNSQASGYGLNLSVMYNNKGWSIGPYVKYWNIAKSDTAYATIKVNGGSVSASAYEPANETIEYGFKITHDF